MGRPCLMIGGGPVALRKAAALLRCGAEVAVVSPELSGSLRKLAQQREIAWR